MPLFDFKAMTRYKHITMAICLVALVLAWQSVSAQETQDIEGQKLAQTGMKFLSQSVDARAAALGNAMTALGEGSSTAMFYNPAAMAHMEDFSHLALGRVQWIGDISYNAGSIALQPANGAYGVVGVSVMSVDYGEFLGTIRAENEEGFVDTGTFSPSALSVGVGYARALTDQFSLGANVKYAGQHLGTSILGYDEEGSRTYRERSMNTFAVDFGVLYDTGFRSLNFAVNARNFSREQVYVEENFELPLLVSIGFSMDVFEMVQRQSDAHGFLLTVDASHPRDYPEQVKVGGEYQFMDILAVRAGYAFPEDERNLSLGAGLQTAVNEFDFSFDYAFTQFGRFGNVNRLSVSIGL
jgi:hypothetical protein